MPSRLGQRVHRVWAILGFAIKMFFRIDGVQWAGAFAFDAFFSLFPLMILLVTIASFIIDQDRAGKIVIAHMESYIPINGEKRRAFFGTIAGVFKARGKSAEDLFVIYLKNFATLNAMGHSAISWHCCCGFTFPDAFSSSAPVYAPPRPKGVSTGGNDCGKHDKRN